MDIKTFCYGGIRQLPLSIAGTMILLGFGTANYAIILFLLGYLCIVPLLTSGINLVGTMFLEGSDLLSTEDIPSKSTLTTPVPIPAPDRVFTHWMSMIPFFFGYIINNALHLYTREGVIDSIEIGYDAKNPNRDVLKESPNIKHKTSQRKNQSVISFICILLGIIVIAVYRGYAQYEKWPALIIGPLLFFFIGYLWYYLLSLVGQDRLSDLFGIANRLLPPSAIQNSPVACVPVL
jgi:hypothetical protein